MYSAAIQISNNTLPHCPSDLESKYLLASNLGICKVVSTYLSIELWLLPV